MTKASKKTRKRSGAPSAGHNKSHNKNRDKNRDKSRDNSRDNNSTASNGALGYGINSIFDTNPDGVFFMPVGGCQQVGLNMSLYGYQGHWLAVDLGIGFGIPEIVGADVGVIDPRIFDWLGSRLSGLVITHAHEDHIGALPYLISHVRCPIFMTRFAREFCAHKFEAARIPLPQLRKLEVNDSISIGPMQVKPVQMPHSIPETMGLVIQCGKHKVFHSSDWKVDPSQKGGDLDSIIQRVDKAIGADLLAVVGDSTNSALDTSSGDESLVSKRINQVLSGLKDTVVVTLFASNLSRVLEIMRAGIRCGRSPVLLGRSLWRIFDVASACGAWDEDIQPLADRDVGSIPGESLLYIATGCQGERHAALTKIARHDHQHLSLGQDDNVIFSSSMIPGNERAIQDVYNRLTRAGVNIYGEGMGLHVSGHAGADAIEALYKKLSPSVVVPAHGEYYMRSAHDKIAKDCGAKWVPLPSDGECVDLAGKNPDKCVKLCEPEVHAIEGNTLVPVSSSRFARRERMMRNGEIIISCITQHGELDLSSVIISLPGIEDQDGSLEQLLLEELRFAVNSYPSNHSKGRSKGRRNGAGDSSKTADKIKHVIRKTIREKYDKNPHISVHLHDL